MLSLRAVALLGFVFFLAVAVSSAGCPRKWVRRGDSCYLLSNRYFTAYNYASTWCRGAGGQLVSINDKAEQEFIYNLVAKEDGPRERWFVGLHTREDGTFAWQDGTVIDGTDVYWAKTQPNNRALEKCGYFVPDKYGAGLADSVCARRCYSICEIKLN